jgi:hypothetical protein
MPELWVPAPQLSPNLKCRAEDTPGSLEESKMDLAPGFAALPTWEPELLLIVSHPESLPRLSSPQYSLPGSPPAISPRQDHPHHQNAGPSQPTKTLCA